MTNKVEFLKELADLMEKHDVALCARQEGSSSASAYFITGPYDVSKYEKILTNRCHSTAYEIRIIADDIKRKEVE